MEAGGPNEGSAKLVEDSAKVAARTKKPRAGSLEEAKRRIAELEDELSEVSEELDRSERRVEAMKQIGQVLGSNLELDVLLARLVDRVSDLLDADRSTLFFSSPDGTELRSKVMQGDELREIRLQYGVGLAGWVAENDEAVHIKDAYNDPRFNPEVDKRTGYRTRCMLVWPIRDPHRGGVTGVIQVLNKHNGAFDRTDERLLSAIASEIGVALAASGLYQEVVQRNEDLERARRRLTLLFETERAISDSDTLEKMLQDILKTALGASGARSGVLYLLDEAGVTVEAAASAGVAAASLRRLRHSARDPMYRDVLSEGDVQISTDGDLKRGRTKVKEMVMVPISTKYDGNIGILELINKESGDTFTDGEIAALEVVASQAGRAIAGERHRLNRTRAENLATIGRALSGVVHDMRTPLTLVSGYADMMAGSDDADARKKYSESLVRQVELINTMTKDLLAFARGEASLLVRKVYVGRFMDEIREYLEAHLAGSKIELVVDARYKGKAKFDETKMHRVFHNLVKNAQDAMPQGGCVTLVADERDERLVFEVQDDGPGIPSELEGRLFEPFVTAGKEGGTGLGLAMVARIAEEHGGDVTCESSSDGTRFTVSLPFVA